MSGVIPPFPLIPLWHVQGWFHLLFIGAIWHVTWSEKTFSLALRRATNPGLFIRHLFLRLASWKISCFFTRCTFLGTIPKRASAARPTRSKTQFLLADLSKGAHSWNRILYTSNYIFTRVYGRPTWPLVVHWSGQQKADCRNSKVNSTTCGVAKQFGEEWVGGKRRGQGGSLQKARRAVTKFQVGNNYSNRTTRLM